MKSTDFIKAISEIKYTYPVYHGSNMEVINPKIITKGFTKDFGYGFYVTNNIKQAVRFTNKFKKKIINKYIYDENKISNLKVKKFDKMDDDW